MSVASEPGNYPWVSTRDAAAAAVVGYPMFISPSGGGGVRRDGRWQDWIDRQTEFILVVLITKVGVLL